MMRARGVSLQSSRFEGEPRAPLPGGPPCPPFPALPSLSSPPSLSPGEAPQVQAGAWDLLSYLAGRALTSSFAPQQQQRSRLQLAFCKGEPKRTCQEEARMAGGVGGSFCLYVSSHGRSGPHPTIYSGPTSQTSIHPFQRLQEVVDRDVPSS